MQITHAKLTKEKLARLSERDRTLFFLLGNTTNELNILQKLMLMLRTEPSSSRMVDVVEAGQTMFFLRMLVGKIHEARVLLQERVNDDVAFKERFGLIDKSKNRSPLRAELSKVNRHFRKWGGLLNAIRDKLAFPSTDDDGLLEQSFQRLGSAEPWDFYLAPQSGNSFYYAAELVMTKAAIDLTEAGRRGGEDAERAGLLELRDSALVAAGKLTRLFDQLLLEILAKGIDEAIEHIDEDIGDRPKLNDFHLPYFFDMTGLRGSKASETG